MFRCESPFLTDGIANHDASIRNPNHFQRLVLRNAFDRAVESKHLAGGENFGNRPFEPSSSSVARRESVARPPPAVPLAFVPRGPLM